MKKFCIVGVLCLLAQPVLAQSPVSPQIKGGINLANVSEVDLEELASLYDTKNSFGIAAGAGLRFPLGGPVSLQGEALFSMKGYETDEFEIFGTSNRQKVRMNYIDVPVLAVISLNEQFDIYGGGYADFFMSGEIETEILSVKETADIDSDLMTSPGYGAVVGGAVHAGSITIEGRYYHGLSDIFDVQQEIDLDDVDAVEASALEIHHRVIQVLVGVTL